LLKILKLPPSTTLGIRCTSENTATNNDHHILSLVSAHFHDPAPVEIKSFTATLNRVERSISFAAYTYLPTLPTHPSYVFEGDLNGGAALALSFHAPFEADVDILGQVCSMLPISNIEFLSISTPNVRSLNCQWGELFQRCAKLTMINVDGHGASRFLMQLRPPKPKKPPSGEKGRKGKLDDRGVPAPTSSSHTATADMPVPTFPKLTSLFIKGLDFCEPDHHPDALYDVLSTMLRRRRTCKIPLKMLRFDYCIVTTNRANALRKLVPEFAQHGYGPNDSSPDESGDWSDLSVGSTEDRWED
jgi:hypothetical protein